MPAPITNNFIAFCGMESCDWQIALAPKPSLSWMRERWDEQAEDAGDEKRRQ